MLRQITPSTRSFSTAPVALAGRQGGRKKPAVKYAIESMPKFEFDDQTTHGHFLFENVREVRKYLRKTEYEMPKLNVYKKPFEAPKADEILKVKTHNYLGEGHDVERKVAFSVKVDDLQLSESEKHKFLLLSGPRFNVNRKELVMSSEKFPHRKQNKMFLLDTVKKLLKESKNKNETFEDVPLNLPKPKEKLKFPQEWLKPKGSGPSQ